jgi:hypothetical protein
VYLRSWREISINPVGLPILLLPLWLTPVWKYLAIES